jgi:pyridoxamine 5'-phosphate oxidase
MHANPFEEFAAWYALAQQADLVEPTAMSLATVSPEGRPSSRVVLLKGFDERGLVFYTNYNSRKGRQLELNDAVALMFWWPSLGRQVRVEGRAGKVSAQESDDYFATRPFGSQVGALASPQSEPIEHTALHRRFATLFSELEGRRVDRPAHWGGYRVVPDRFEFWQNRDNRLHDRIVYALQADNTWQMTRIAP